MTNNIIAKALNTTGASSTSTASKRMVKLPDLKGHVVLKRIPEGHYVIYLTGKFEKETYVKEGGGEEVDAYVFEYTLNKEKAVRRQALFSYDASNFVKYICEEYGDDADDSLSFDFESALENAIGKPLDIWIVPNDKGVRDTYGNVILNWKFQEPKAKVAPKLLDFDGTEVPM
jgi:hypothetical protein